MDNSNSHCEENFDSIKEVSFHYCTLCQNNCDSIQAVSWCLECEDWLCSNCEKHHGKAKLSKQHKTITVAVFESFPPSVLKISNRCTVHNDSFVRFCSIHQVPCCVECSRDTHKECELNSLVGVLQHVKESAAVSQLESDLKEIKQQLETMEKHLSNRLEKVKDESKHCINEIKRIRTSVNEHLDTIEKTILNELSQKEQGMKEAIEALDSQLKSKKRTLVKVQDSLLKTKQYATDLQIFLYIKEMETQIAEDTNSIKELEQDDAMVDKSIEYEVSMALESLQRDIVTFGQISVKWLPSTLQLMRTSKEQTLLTLPVRSTIDEVNVVQKLTINLTQVTGKPSQHNTENPTPYIAACQILPTGECVFLDNNRNRLLMYNSNGKYRDGLNLTSRPSDICYITDKLVGISFPYEKKVQFVDVSQHKIVDASRFNIVRTVNMETMCYELDYSNEKLYVRLPEENVVVIMDLDGRLENRVHIPGNDVTSMAAYRNFIYCAYWKDSQIVCYDMNGRVVWKNQYEELVQPRSITIDRKLGIIYIAGYNSNNIMAVSLNGEQSKIVLSDKDSLNHVCSVRVNINNKLVLCNESDGMALLCQL